MSTTSPVVRASAANRPFEGQKSAPSVFSILRPYWPLILVLAVLSITANGLTLWVPKIIAGAIDAHQKGNADLGSVWLKIGSISIVIFLLAYGQSAVQTFVSERVARDLRNTLADRISRQSYAFVQRSDPARLLTNLTSDMDSVKLFVAQAIVSLISSIVLIAGASVLLITIDARLAIAVLTIVPLIGGTFFFTLRRVRELFLRGRAVIDRLNRVINESVYGSALIRILNAQSTERTKFESANAASRDIGYSIIRLFSALIPVISFLANIATLIILFLGGHYVINGSLTLGELTAFISYVAILIFPILVLGFISNIVAQANASYARIAPVLYSVPKHERGEVAADIAGSIEARHISLGYGGKMVLDNVSFAVAAGSRTAIVGPTAAGKSQLLYVLTGLVDPDSGEVLIDNVRLDDYNKSALHKQIGFVFQDSIVFNLTLRENIAFTTDTTEAALSRAISTAELQDLILALPDGLETVISERGTSLSGGQKQRLMLARALALNPTILLLDDFTARVDAVTQAKILANVLANYPGITLISVTQIVDAVKDYDQIILMMEGEVLAAGTHESLLVTSPEYMQIYESQRSTADYEL
jgi:ATP-binding cassette subfamily B protein